MEYKQHPEWKDKYSAVDGIAKPDRDFREADLGGEVYSPEQRAIRSDIEKILELPWAQFELWHSKRKKATERLVADYEVFASIPNLQYGSEKHLYDMRAITHVKSHLESLKKGLEYLDILRQVRKELNLDTDKPV